MNKYFVSELIKGSDYSAGSQREDIESILGEEGYKALLFPQGSRSILLRLKPYLAARRIAKQLKKGDIIFFHFPVRSRAFRYFQKLVQKKGCRTIAYEIDLEGLRDNDKILLEREMKQLSYFDLVITQNSVKKQLIESRIGHPHVITYEMHDYLNANCNTYPERKLSTIICFAGNLEKASFIHQLGEADTLTFNIYGATKRIPNANNTSYKGKVSPRELPCLLEGSFGLVWDGSSIYGGEDEGAYLRYNIPHKLALYIMSGLPLIIWNESAIAEWAVSKNYGIAVSSLKDLKTKLAALTENDYETFRRNIEPIRKQMSEGYYLRKAIHLAEQRLP